jgi:RNA-binding protein PNO1
LLACQTPEFPALSAVQIAGGKTEYQRIAVPPHRCVSCPCLTAKISLDCELVTDPIAFCRYTPLKAQWNEIYKPIVEHMKLQIRFNPKKRCVELRVTNFSLPLVPHAPHLCGAVQTSQHTENGAAMQKSAGALRLRSSARLHFLTAKASCSRFRARVHAGLCDQGTVARSHHSIQTRH